MPMQLYALHIEWKKACCGELVVFSTEQKRDDFVFELVNDTWPEEVGDRGPWEILEDLEERGVLGFDSYDVWLDQDDRGQPN